MISLDQTLQHFAPGVITGPAAGPAVGPDPVAEALATLQQMGAATAQPAPMQPPPMPVGPAAPQVLLQQQAQQAPQGWDQAPQAAPQPPGGPAGPAPGQAPTAPTFAPPKPPGTLGQADADLGGAISDVGRAKYDAADAKHQAEVSLGERVAGVQTESVNAMEELQQATVVTRQRNAAQSDMETANWIQELQTAATKEPNPSRWWESQSRLGKAMWALSLVFGAGYAATTPGGKNAGMEIVRQEMAQDMEEQRQRLGREISALKVKGETMKDRQARLASDLKDDHAYGLTRINALERAWMARATIPGDQDAIAMKEAARAEFAAMKLPYVESFRNQKIAEKEAATSRQFQADQSRLQRNHAAGMQRAGLTHDTSERVAQNQFTNEENRRKHGEALELSPVSVSASYTPGGAIPKDPKTGLPLMSELQSGTDAKSAGLILKGPDGKPANGTGAVRFKDYKDMVSAGETVMKANKRYTATQKLLDILDTADPGVLDSLKAGTLGTTNPAMADVVNELGYEIAKSHDARVTNQDFSKGVSQAMGFDPDGNWLQRGKFITSVDDIRAKLRNDLNAMQERVAETFRPLNDAAINGQGTELVWDPHMLTGEKVQEQNSGDIEGRPPLDSTKSPVTSVKDYIKKSSTERDPEERGRHLPPHDAGVVRSIINTTEGRGPKTVAAKAATVLEKLEARRAELVEKMGAASPTNLKTGFYDPVQPDPWYHPSGDEPAKYQAELEKVHNTIDIARAIASDAEKRAAANVKRVTDKVGKDWSQSFVSEEWIREEAKRQGLGGAAEEVDAIIEKFRTYKASNLGRLQRGGR